MGRLTAWAAACLLAVCCGTKAAPVASPGRGAKPAVDAGGREEQAPEAEPGTLDKDTPEEPEADAADGGAAPEVIVATHMEGPYAKLGEVCPGCKKVQKPAGPAHPPLLEVALLSSEWSSPAPGDRKNTSYHLGVRTQQGWFLLRYLGTDGELCGGDHLFWVSFDPVSLEMKDVVPGEPPEVVLWFEESANDIDDVEIAICGVGPSGKPSCVGPLIAARDDGYGTTGSFESSVALPGDGSMEFIDEDGGSDGPLFIELP